MPEKKGTMVAMVLVAAIVFGGFLGAQTQETRYDAPVPSLPSYPVYNGSVNETLNYGEHWTVVSINALASTDINVSIIVSNLVAGNLTVNYKGSAQIVVENATDGQLILVWYYVYTDSVRGPFMGQVTEPLSDQSIVFVYIQDDGQWHYTIQQPGDVPQ